MAGPAHGIMGEDQGFDLPEVQVPEQDLANERRAARFAKSREFKDLKAHLENRISFYQTYLPSGNPVVVNQDTLLEMGQRWVVANDVIMELKAIINAYEQAAEAVSSADRRETTQGI